MYVKYVTNEHLKVVGTYCLFFVFFVRLEWLDEWISIKYIRLSSPPFPPFDFFSNSVKRGVPFQEKIGMEGGKSNAFRFNGEPHGGVDEETGKDGAGKGVAWVNGTPVEVK